MRVDARDLLDSAGLKNEGFYPGKRIVRKYVQHGEHHKSHCMVFSWEDNIIRAELKAGLSGGTIDPKELRQYPVSFQARTYIDIETANDSKDKDDDEEGSARGKSGGGGKKPKRDIDDSSLTSMSAFAKMADVTVSTVGEIKKFVIMGKEIAQEAYAQALDNLKAQISQTKVMAMDLMKGVSGIIHKATPGGGLTAKGDETIKYRYDAEKTAPMFGGLTPS